MTRLPSPPRQSQRFSATRAESSPTKATRAAGTRRRARSRQEENSAPATRGKTRISRASAHRSSGRWPTSSRSNTAHRLPAAAQDLPDVVPSDDRTVLLPSEPRILNIISDKTHTSTRSSSEPAVPPTSSAQTASPQRPAAVSQSGACDEPTSSRSFPHCLSLEIPP